MTPSTDGLVRRATKRTIGLQTSPGSRPLSGDPRKRKQHEPLAFPRIDRRQRGLVHAGGGANGLVCGRHNPHPDRSRLGRRPSGWAAPQTDGCVVDTTVTRAGAVAGAVDRYGLPGSDLNVSLDGVAIKPGFALG